MAERVTRTVVVMATLMALVCDGQFEAAQDSDATHTASIVVAIRNTFPTFKLAIKCDAATEPRSGVTVLNPKDTFTFVVNPEVQHRRTCRLSADDGRGDLRRYDGAFVMWQDHMPIPPMREPMCDDRCTWIVDADGLSLIRRAGSEPVHVYDWTWNAGARRLIIFAAQV